MEKNKLIIIALVVIIIALVVGIFAFMPNMNKQDTKLTFVNNSTIYEWDSIEIQLTDKNGTPLVNQTVNVTITEGNKSNDYQSVISNGDGIGTIKLNKSAGSYDLTVSYRGNDKYNACNATQKITIKEKVVEESANQNNKVSTSSSNNEDNGYWETSPDAPFEYHTEYDSSGGFRQYDKAGRLVGSSYDEDQDKIADYVPRRI